MSRERLPGQDEAAGGCSLKLAMRSVGRVWVVVEASARVTPYARATAPPGRLGFAATKASPLTLLQITALAITDSF